MRLQEALQVSPVETAELETDDATVVVQREDDNGYTISWHKGAMPAYAEESVQTTEAVEVMLKQTYGTRYTPDQWTANED